MRLLNLWWQWATQSKFDSVSATRYLRKACEVQFYV